MNLPVRLVFTADFQGAPFGLDPVWGGWREGSMARAMSYIRSHRRAMGEEHLVLVACGPEIPAQYTLYPEDFAGRILAYCGYGTVPECIRMDVLPGRETDLSRIARRTGVDLAVAAFGREPEVCRVVNIEGDTVTVINLGTTGKYIGVADFSSPKEFTVKTVDISGFPVDAEYEAHFKPLSDSIHTYYHTPLTDLTQTVRQSDALFGSSAYAGLFHRFQLETTGADISLFACPVRDDSIPAGGLTPRDILRRFRYENRLCVIGLSGEELVEYLEYTYGLRYHTMRRSTDDLLRMTRDRDGVLQLRTAVYNLDEAGGICYEVDVSRPQGRRIRMISGPAGKPFVLSERYRVAVNSHRLENGVLSRACGMTDEQIRERLLWESAADYRLLLREWLSAQHEIAPENPDNWQVVPESFVEPAGLKLFNPIADS